MTVWMRLKMNWQQVTYYRYMTAYIALVLTAILIELIVRG